MITADALNEHVKNGGIVQVTNHMKSWVIDSPTVEFFKNVGTDLYMRRGKQWDCIGSKTVLYAKIQTGYYK